MDFEIKHLPYIPLRVTSGYGDRTKQVAGIKGATAWHDGVDIGRDKKKYPSGMPPCGNVYAVLDGVVTESKYNRARGYYVKIFHGIIGGYPVHTISQHLARFGASSGTRVKAGDVIGQMGASGVGNATHLHFELHINNRTVDPLPYLRAVEKKGFRTAVVRSRIQEKKTPIQELKVKLKAQYHFQETTIKDILHLPYGAEIARKMIYKEALSEGSKKNVLRLKNGGEIFRRVYGE